MTPQPATLVVDSRALHRQPGASLRVAATVAAGAELANDVARAEPGSLRIDLLLESVLDGILVTGTATVPIVAECVRCLEEVHRIQSVEFQQFFAYPGVSQGEADTGVDGADVVPMSGEDLDLTDAFRDAVLLALPLTPTCRPDCPGLCPECGVRLAEHPGHKHEHQDPRWSGLAQWRATDQSAEGE